MPDSRLSLWLFTAALLARAVSCMGLGLFGPDGPNFLIMGDWMREGRFQDALSMAYHPLYPLLIAVAGPAAGGSIPAGHAVSILLGAAACVPLFFVTRELFGRPSAFFATLIYALHPRIVDVQSDVMTESTFMCFFLGSMAMTWRMAEQPSMERGITLALAASGAFLTRPEGILAVVLAVCWPAADLLARRKLDGKALGALAVMTVSLMVLMFPYLLWVKSVRGHWGLSVRPSLLSAELATGVQAGSEGRTGVGSSKLYWNYFQSILRLNLHGALFPFHLLGLWSLKSIGLRRILFYGAFTGGLMGGVLLTLRMHDAMSDRYLMVPMTLLGGLAGLGLATLVREAARRRPDARWRPALCGALVLALAVLPSFRWLHVRRMEDRSYAVAADWIRSQGKPVRAVSGTAQVAYLAGARPVLPPATPEQLRSQIEKNGVEYFVYDERDVASRVPMVGMLASSALVGPAETFRGPAGTLAVYVQRVR